MADPVAEVLTRMRAVGKRATPERTLLIEIITANPHLDADQIYRIAKRRHPQIGLATVYRTLNLLQEFDVIRANGLGENHAHYEIRDEDHIHLVCSRCGSIVDVPAPSSLDALAKQHGFQVERTHFEWVGLCAKCAAHAGDDAAGV